MNTSEIKEVAKKVRIDIIEMLAASGSGHPGGSLSIADILTLLYFDKMKIKVEDPKWEDRDRLVLSKGHAAPALYAVLAEKEYFDKIYLKTLRQVHSILQGHPDVKSTPGVDMTTGSLGQGLSAANGIALAGKLDNKDYKVYVVLGDGELQEGQVWEAAMSAAHYKLDNVLAFVDNNGLQIDGRNEDVMNVNPITDKFAAFGWNVICANGHDLEDLSRAIDIAKTVKGKPTVIIAKTVKGKGVSFMENEAGWHGVAPNDEQTQAAIEELKGGEK
ncbi:transketolase [Clostridium sp. DJ247]|uniref:transketolase n=1 Tax=Clostridium sp. DJ247 TaxID=2726188 RepID=UPI001624174F|nr:transketolase [Clostridium sp. DJ247]MBC2579598.1 transketolase [Clostridium sp. DJ247]